MNNPSLPQKDFVTHPNFLTVQAENISSFLPKRAVSGKTTSNAHNSAATSSSAFTSPTLYAASDSERSPGVVGRAFSGARPSVPPLGNTDEIRVPSLTEGYQTHRRTAYKLQDAVAKLLPMERCARCGRTVALKRNADGELALPKKIDVSHDGRRAHVHNLLQCDSVWTCPVCSGRIGEQDRVEMTLGLAAAQAMGFQVMHVTFTLSHHVNERCAVVLSGLKKATRQVTNERWGKAFKARWDYRGWMEGLENTYSDDTGWHWHTHALMVFGQHLDANQIDTITDELKRRWTAVLARGGRYASYEHGIIVKTAHSDLADYVAKFGREPINSRWSPEHEVAKSNVKKARTEKGRTPFQLLADYDNGDEQAGALFVEYARAVKGKRRVRWSPGLKQLLMVDQPKPDESADDCQAEADRVTLVSLWVREWHKICVMKKRAEFMDVADQGSPELILNWLDEVGVRAKPAPVTHGGCESADRSARRRMVRHDLENWSRLEWIDQDTGEIFSQRE